MFFTFICYYKQSPETLDNYCSDFLFWGGEWFRLLIFDCLNLNNQLIIWALKARKLTVSLSDHESCSLSEKLLLPRDGVETYLTFVVQNCVDGIPVKLWNKTHVN